MKKLPLFFVSLFILVFFLNSSFLHAEEYEFLRSWQPGNGPRGLAVDKDGNLYSAADQRVIKYSPTGTKLLEIKNLPNETAYFGSWDMWVAVDDLGNIYVSSQQDHKIIKFDSLGNYVTQWGGTQGSGNAEFNEPQGIDVDSDGNVYVCDKQNRRIMKFDSSGTLLTKWGIQGDGDGQFQGPKDLAVDRINNKVYVLDEWQWPRRIQVFDLNGTYLSQWAMTTGDSRVDQPNGIGIDKDGNVYVSEAQGDNINKVVKFSSTGTYITHLGGPYGYDNYHFNGLQDVAIDYSGNLYLSDHQWGNYGDVGHRVMKYKIKGTPTILFTNPADNSFVTGTVSIQASLDIESGYTVSTVEVYINDAKLGDATASSLQNYGDARITAATTYSLDWDTTQEDNGPHTVWIVTTNNEGSITREKITSTVVNGDEAPTVEIDNLTANQKVRGTVDIQATASDDNAVAKVEFYVDGEKVGQDTSSPFAHSWDTTTLSDDTYPIKAIAYDALGQYAEHGFNVIVNNYEGYGFVKNISTESWGHPTDVEVDKNDNLYIAMGSNVVKLDPYGNLLLRLSGDWGGNTHLTVDDSGNIYISDQNNTKIYKYNSSGTLMTQWGKSGAKSTEFHYIEGLTVDSVGDLYICDSSEWGEDYSANHKIAKYDSSGLFKTSWGGWGWGNGQFASPRDVAADSADLIYVVEPWAQRIQVFDKNGNYQRHWGQPGTGDGQLQHPSGIGIDSENRVYVTDNNNNRVTRFSSTGTFQTQFGSNGQGDGELQDPHGVAVDSNGLVYVADHSNRRVVVFKSTWVPTVSIISPTEDESINGITAIQASVDSSIDISKVEIYIDGNKVGDALVAANFQPASVGTATTTTYQYLWDTEAINTDTSLKYPDGTYEIKIKAINTQNQATEATVSAIVNNGGDQPPKVTLTNPIDGDTVRIQSEIKATVTSSLTITKVEFFIDDVEIGEVTTSPYAFTWDATSGPEGERTIKVRAEDSKGLSTAVSITVNVVNHEEFGLFKKWSLDNPTGIAVDKNGNVYTANCDNRIRKYDSDGNLLFTIEGNTTDYNLTCNMRLVIDDSGNIYAALGDDRSAIVKFDSLGKYVTKWGSFGTANDQFTRPTGIAIDSEGYLYICDIGDPETGNHRIVKYDANGVFQAKWGGWGSGPGFFQWPMGIAIDSEDNVYVMDHGNHRVQKFDKNGTFLAQWGEHGTTYNQFRWPQDITIDSEDNLYIADTDNTRVVMYKTDGTFIAKFGSQGSGDLQLSHPWAIAVSPDFYIYVVDQGQNNRIMKFRSTWRPTNKITNPGSNEVVKGTVTIQVSAGSDAGIKQVDVYVDNVLLGQASVASYLVKTAAWSIATQTYEYSWNTTGYDDGAHIVKTVVTNIQNKTNTTQTTVVVNNSNDEAPTVEITSPSEGDTVRLQTTIKATATDATGISKVEFYVDDRLINTATASPYEYTWDATTVLDGTRTIKVTAYDTISQNVSASIEVTVNNRESYAFVKKWSHDNPNGVAIDKDGNLWVTGGHRISKYKTDGTLLLRLKDSDSAEFRLDWELFVATDSSGNIYVLNTNRNYVMKFSSEGQYIKKWGVQGTGDGELNWPLGIAVDANGKVYVADSDNHRIQRFDSDGTYETQWGSRGGSDGQFESPRGVAVDSSNNVYVSEAWNSRISVFDSDGNFLRKWADHGFGNNQLNHPRGLTLDSEGNVYVSDENNNRIMKFSSTGTYITQWGIQGSGDLQFERPIDIAVDAFGFAYVADKDNNRIVKFRSTWLPQVQITTPDNNEIINGTYKIQADITSDIGISKVEVYIDGELLGEATTTFSSLSRTQLGITSTSTYEYDWNSSTAADGTHTVKVIATNIQNKSTEDELSAIVNNSGNQVPTVTITNPQEGDTVRRTVTIKADVEDAEGINRVEIHIDGTKIGEATAATDPSYEYSWDTTSTTEGNKEVKVVAVDSIDQQTEATVNVEVRNNDFYEYAFQWSTNWEEENGLGHPNSIAVDNLDYVYATFGETIGIYDATGTFVFAIRNGEGDYRLTNDMKIAVDSRGNIYVSSPGVQTVIKFDSQGNYLTKWGSKGSGDDQFTEPYGIAVDSQGNVYVCDGWNHDDQEGNNRIVKFDSNGTYLAQWGSRGNGNDQFEFPYDVAIDSADNVYVLDHWENQIKVYDSDGTFIRRWGSWGYGDTNFQHPNGIGMDKEDNIYIADTNNQRIVKYASNGTLKAIWGKQGSGDENFEWPNDVAVSSTGYVYVADSNNRRIIVFALKGLPKVNISNPTHEATVSGTQKVRVRAESVYGIKKVELYIDDVKVDEASVTAYRGGIKIAATTIYNYEYDWITDSPDSHNGSVEIKAVAYNVDDRSSETSISVVVNNGGDLPPTLQITDPKDDTVIRGTVKIKADASDPEGGITRVQFYIGNTLLETIFTTPYEHILDTTSLPDGEKTIRVEAYDTIGQKTWDSITVILDNAERIFSIDLASANAIYLTQDHRLMKIDDNGFQAPVVSEDIKVRNFQFDPWGKLYVVLQEKQQLRDGNHYILIKVNPETGETEGIDPSLEGLVWNERSTSPNIQFDQYGNIYYFAEAWVNDKWERVLRKYVNANNIEDIINDNIEIFHWIVRNNGTIVIVGKTISLGETWLRKISPKVAGVDARVENIAEPDWGWWEWGWMAKFPDDLIYVTLRGSWAELDGIYRLADDLHRLLPTDADVPYIGNGWEKPNSLYKLEDITAGHSDEYVRGILEEDRGRMMINIETDSNNQVYGLAGHYGNKYRTVIKLYPGPPEIIEPPLIDRASLMAVSLDQLIIAGFDNWSGRYKLLLYDPVTTNTINLMTDNIEIYHLDALSNGWILFDGLNMETNDVIIGMFERTQSTSGDASAQEYTYKELANLGRKTSDKPLGFGVIKDVTEPEQVLTVEITTPKDGGTVGGLVEIKARTYSVQGVSKVEFFVDGTLKDTISIIPFSTIWDSSGYVDGSHTIKAIVYDLDDEISEHQISVILNNNSPNIAMSTQRMEFGAVYGGGNTSAQQFRISNAGTGTLDWEVSSSVAWITTADASTSATSGQGSAVINVSVTPAGLSVGTYSGEVLVTSTTASNSPTTVTVSLTVKELAATKPPFGVFATPTDGETGITGATPVTGWVLDDIEVTKVEIWRDSVAGEASTNGFVFIGNAVFVEGARPDIEVIWPEYPVNHSAGWGYMLLTNFLPNKGNGTYKLHAIAGDVDGHSISLGSITISCDNDNAVKPFGTVETPAQGGEASGIGLNWGWVLTPQPNEVPKDGSTISVYIDSDIKGTLDVYDLYRSDVSKNFPRLKNSDGPFGYWTFDTTSYENGVHTIYWVAYDDAGNGEGIGSRYFTIVNLGASSTQTLSQEPSFHLDSTFTYPSLSSIPKNYGPIHIKSGFRLDQKPQELYPGYLGDYPITLREVERIELDLGKGTQFSGYQLVGDKFRPLPVGSTLDTLNGRFYWLPGPGFVGEYDLVFIKRDIYGNLNQIKVKVNIIPKFSLK